MKSVMCRATEAAMLRSGEGPAVWTMAAHLAHCEGCRAEMERERAVRREMRALATVIEPAPDMLHARVMRVVEGADQTVESPIATVVRPAVVAAGAGAAVATAVIVAVLVRRRIGAAA